MGKRSGEANVVWNCSQKLYLFTTMQRRFQTKIWIWLNLMSRVWILCVPCIVSTSAERTISLPSLLTSTILPNSQCIHVKLASMTRTTSSCWIFLFFSFYFDLCWIMGRCSFCLLCHTVLTTFLQCNYLFRRMHVDFLDCAVGSMLYFCCSRGAQVLVILYPLYYWLRTSMVGCSALLRTL